MDFYVILQKFLVMRKILTALTVLAVAAGLSSCQLNKEENYAFGYDCFIRLYDEDEDKAEADTKLVETFMKQKFINQLSGSYFGYYADAYDKAEDLYYEGIKSLSRADVEYLLSFIDDSEDFIELGLILSGENLRLVVGSLLWSDETRDWWLENVE